MTLDTRGFLEAARLSDDWVRDMGNQALIKEAHHTTHIEGTRLTLDQAERLWRGETVPEADPEDTRELLNYRSAFEFVSECLDSGDPITEAMIREIHRKLVDKKPIYNILRFNENCCIDEQPSTEVRCLLLRSDKPHYTGR